MFFLAPAGWLRRARVTFIEIRAGILHDQLPDGEAIIRLAMRPCVDRDAPTLSQSLRLSSSCRWPKRAGSLSREGGVLHSI